MIQLRLKNELSYIAGEASTKVQTFQVRAVRFGQSDPEQQVSCVSKINLGVKLVFCIWVGIHKIICVFLSSHVRVSE